MAKKPPQTQGQPPADGSEPKSGMTGEEIANAGYLIDVPFESGVAEPAPLEYMTEEEAAAMPQRWEPAKGWEAKWRKSLASVPPAVGDGSGGDGSSDGSAA